MRRTMGGVALVVAVGLIGLVLGRSIAAPPTTQEIVHQGEEDAGLNRMVDEIEFRDTPMHEGIDALRRKTDANIVVRWEELESVGVDRNTPITLHLKQLSLGRMLEMLCELSGGGTVDLAAEEDRGVIIVSTVENLGRQSVLRLYDVRDLLQADEDLRARLDPPPATQPGLMQRRMPYTEGMDNLKYIIMDTVAPDTWRDAGGTIGSMHDFNGRLLITTTPQFHKHVAEVLEKIRKG